MHAPKWFKGQVDLEVGDLVYFQRTGNELGSKYGRWTVGDIDELERSSDNKIRRVWVKYKNIDETGFQRTERSVRALVKIFSINDLSIQEDLLEVQKVMLELLKVNRMEEDQVRGTDVGESNAVVSSCCEAHVNRSEIELFMENYLDDGRLDLGSLWDMDAGISYGDNISEDSLQSLLSSVLAINL